MQEFSVLLDPNVRRCAAVGRARQVPGHVLSGDPRVEAEALPDLYVKHEPKKPKQSTAGGRTGNFLYKQQVVLAHEELVYTYQN